MKKGFCILSALLFLFIINSFAQTNQYKKIIVITTDGFRWQEVFNGLDKDILKFKSFQNGDSLNTVKNFGGATPEESRKKILPFFWSTIVKKGQIHGNRNQGSLVDNSNPNNIKNN